MQLLGIVFNPFPNKPWFLCVCSTSLWKTLWEKEKLLVTCLYNFLPFSLQFRTVVSKPFQFGRVQNLSFGKGFNREVGMLEGVGIAGICV